MELKNKKVKVLFVCLGNICRSPMAEGAFNYWVGEFGLAEHFEVDSAGTALYHVGSLADDRMRQVATKHGIELHSLARQLKKVDLEYYDYILAMDRQNYSIIKKLTDRPLNNLYLMRDFDKEGSSEDVPDPYYGDLSGFEDVYEIQLRSCEKLLDQICRAKRII